MISALVLRNDAKHLPQMLKAFARVARLAKRSLRGLVIGREVSRHDTLGVEASALRHSGPARTSEVYFTSPGRRSPQVRNGACFRALMADDQSVRPNVL